MGKRHRISLKRRRSEKNKMAGAEYAKILAQSAEGAEGGQGAAPQEDCFSEGVQEVHQQPVDGQVAVVTFSCEQANLANLKQPRQENAIFTRHRLGNEL